MLSSWGVIAGIALML
jgi:hypothetical protein